ncbi:uncharacterized protein LOC113293345 [Papaver somniferum]|uniref:uncharacterized protein LOC113293345 n=1 Tax=Papaver somniferum TaxID=3469 RepID=UPI000E6FDA18|nr:uncharacterized protein LOC113293345 [Papaver somniferum]
MTDSHTALKTRMNFARICVEVDTDCTYPAEIPYRIDNEKFVVRAEYPWKPPSCTHCKSFGHPSGKCKLAPKTKTIWIPKRAPSIPIDTADVGTREENVTIEQGGGIGKQMGVVEINNSSNSTQERIESAKGDDVLDLAPKPAEGNWINPKKKKKSGKKGEKVLQESTVLQNPYNILDSEMPFANLSEEEIVEEDISIENTSEPGEVRFAGIEKKKSDAENAINSSREERSKETSSKQVDALFKFSALLGASNGATEEEKRSIFTEITDKHQKTRKERELEKLGLKSELSNDLLGRGQRKSAKKKY